MEGDLGVGGELLFFDLGEDPGPVFGDLLGDSVSLLVPVGAVRRRGWGIGVDSF